jgi:hypothetical protein
MTLVKKTIRERFPKSTFALAIMLIIVIVIMVDWAFLNWAIVSFLYTTFVIGTINFFMAAPLQVIATAGIILGVIGIIKYKQKYGKKEVLMQSPAAPLQGGLVNTQPLQPQNTGQVIIEDDNQ